MIRMAVGLSNSSRSFSHTITSDYPTPQDTVRYKWVPSYRAPIKLFRKCCGTRSSHRLELLHGTSRSQGWTKVSCQTNPTSNRSQPGPHEPPNPGAGPSPPRGPHPLWRGLTQLLQVAVVLSALILLPARLFSGEILSTHWLLYAAYVVFFGIGSVARIARFGNLAKRKEDAQVKTRFGTAALLLFIACLPAGHWLAAYDFARFGPSPTGGAGRVLGPCLVGGALLFHLFAVQALGKSYDRLVTPDTLVTSGPYSLVQHPIYTSYIALFAGYCISLGSWRAATLITACCFLYYSHRTAIERQILSKAFGRKYLEYEHRTARFIPFLW